MRILLLLSLLAASAPARELPTLDELRTLRKKAADRPRRILFNNDGNEPVYLCEDNTPEALLRHRTAALAGSQVDTIFYCTWSSGFSLFTHGTKAGQVFETREAPFTKNRTAELLAAGTDPLRVMAEFSHRNGMELFWSFRMNDTHDGAGTEYGPVMFRANRLKNEHPEWLIGSPSRKPRFGAWSAVDFTRPEIRALAFRYVEEVCKNYPVDGVELDFFRHPVFFQKAALTGTECNDEERGLMSDLLAKIRAMTEVEGMRRGRPILVAVRVPDSIEYCRASGIDLGHWLSSGLVDLLIPGGYFQLNDWRDTIALGHRHGVRVYPSLDESRVRDTAAKALRSSVPSYRGRALAAWHAGADGVYLFNSFNPNSPLWREMGSPELLATLPHDYFASVRGLGAAAGGAFPHAGFVRVPLLNPASPLNIKPGTPAEVGFQAGSEPDAPGRKTTLRLQFKPAPHPSALTVALNGTPLRPGTADGTEASWLAFSVEPGCIRKGANTVQVGLQTGAAPIQWTDLHCTVHP